ncbi:DUF1674-domain-containing protein [Zopfia rhizophila CBS 207.26]|uniref:Succinate dehydrogenase assembly factor 4, mitochondrial n=1 Tax=Zopfia rhizophila CBS 207.26 TaxID=1314779 RepID=A0A6A6EI96_9PEZI|nr:DUF1674-domain-containing protein [Zopfia rhizophila CBS 207.26]
MLQAPRQLSRPLLQRAFNTTPRHSSSPFKNGPSPPRLPKEEQEIFERLQHDSTGAFSTPRSERPPVNQWPDSALSSSTTSSPRFQVNQSPDLITGEGVDIRIEGEGKVREGEELHPNMRRGAPPEFEGDINPKTGEVGGPKNEPLRWGHQGDWSYNGRVTDF